MLSQPAKITAGRRQRVIGIAADGEEGLRRGKGQDACDALEGDSLKAAN
jgi:hypothetical protein